MLFILTLLHACGVVFGDPSLLWSNITWISKEGLADPGANLWADTQDVAAGDGSFSINISPPTPGQVPHQWMCGQVTSQEASSYGTYAFTLITPMNDLDSNVRVTMGVIALNKDGLQSPLISMEIGTFKTNADGDDGDDGANTVSNANTTNANMTTNANTDTVFNARASVRTNTGVVSKTFNVTSSNTTIWHFNWTSTTVSFSVSAFEAVETGPVPAPVELWSWSSAAPKTLPSNNTRTMINAYLDNHQPPNDNKTVSIVLEELDIQLAALTPENQDEDKG